MAAIWKDVFVSLGTGASRGYTIATGGVQIYAGKGYKKPGETDIKVRINDICADHLEQNLPGLTDGAETQHAGLRRTFVVTPSEGTGISKEFHLDWSYDEGAPTQNLSVPVRMRASAGQPVFDTVLGAQSAATTTSKKSSGTVTISGSRVISVDMCDEWSLLYVNAYGGWDSISLSGKVRMTDTYTRKVAGRVYDNSVATGRGKTNYGNGILRSWEMHTGWLTDEEAGRMHHVLGTTEAWLYNNLTGEIEPVIVTNADCVYKTLRNNGREMIDYTLNIESARERERR